jgi:hypothetical protein
MSSIPANQERRRVRPTLISNEVFLNTSLVAKPVIVNDPYNGNTPFPNNQIPGSRFSSVSKTIMDKYYSLPNQSWNTFTNNYGWLHPFNNEQRSRTRTASMPAG